MDLPRLLVTVLGAALVVAVNVYFFARRGPARAPLKPGRPEVKPGPKPADEGPGGR